MSKLESGLFVMTPVDVQLDSIARDAVKMFEGEARSSGVDLMLRLEDSLTQIGETMVSLDPTRVMQVLIVSPAHLWFWPVFPQELTKNPEKRTSSQTQSNLHGLRPHAIFQSASAYPSNGLTTTSTQFMVRCHSCLCLRHRSLQSP